MDSVNAFFHHGFAGGSKNTSRLLHYLAKKRPVTAYSLERPQFFEYTHSDVINKEIPKTELASHVIDSKFLTNYLIIQFIVNELKSTETSTVLLGANLFPYGELILRAKKQLSRLCDLNFKLVLHPVGSDIWQIGTQIPDQVSALLDDGAVDGLFTYSKVFADEITAYFGIRNPIKIIPPVLEAEKFKSLSTEEKVARRKQIGFKAQDLVIHHHSSLRPVKCPEIVIKIAAATAERVAGTCYLIMSGPFDCNKITDWGGGHAQKINKGPFRYRSNIGRLTILWTGLTKQPEYTLQIADVELNASLHDSFNISLMEAIACGVPVVTNEIPGIVPDIRKSSSGIIFQSSRLGFDELNSIITGKQDRSTFFNMEEAVAAIVSLAGQPEVARVIGLAGASYALSTFHPDVIIDKFSRFLTL